MSLVGALGLGVFGSGCGQRSDADIQREVTEQLAEEQELAGATVQASAAAGAVTLSGTAPSAEAREQAAEVAEGVRGVKSVRNEIQVVPDVAAPRAEP
jgi:hyperosmotically inducible protein